MNPQIKELAVEAGLYVDFNGEPWPKNMIGEDIEGAYQKFAELIVRECAEVARLNTRVDSKVYLMIQEHFGVEE